MTDTPYHDLAARIEAADGPDRALDAEIAVAFGWREYKPGWFRPANVDVDHHASELPRYMASIDTALCLVEDGIFPSICFVTKRVWLRDANNHDLNNGPAYGFAKTVPASITAACLRARHVLPADQLEALTARLTWVKADSLRDDYQTRATYKPPSEQP